MDFGCASWGGEEARAFHSCAACMLYNHHWGEGAHMHLEAAQVKRAAVMLLSNGFFCCCKARAQVLRANPSLGIPELAQARRQTQTAPAFVQVDYANAKTY